MLKILGAVFVSLSGSLFGWCMAGELKEKTRLLAEWKRCVLMIRGEIRFANASLPEAFFGIKTRAAQPFDRLFAAVWESLEEQPEKLLGEVWTEQVEKVFSKSVFSKEEIAWMAGFGQQLGYLDKEMQLGMLTLILEQIGQKEKEAFAGLAQKGKVYRCIGTMGGILAALLLA